METNFSQARKWIISAIHDIDRVLKDLKTEDFADIAFRCQFAVKKLNKSILNLMGIKTIKTHTPSIILKDVLRNEEAINIDKKTREILKQICNYSKFFEEEGTKTRYGIFKNGELIISEEIYSNIKDIEKFLKYLGIIIKSFLVLLKDSFKLTDKEIDELMQFEKLMDELKKWV